MFALLKMSKRHLLSITYQLQICLKEIELDKVNLKLVSKELKHLAVILQYYARRLIFMKQKKSLLIFKEKRQILLHF